MRVPEYLLVAQPPTVGLLGEYPIVADEGRCSANTRARANNRAHAVYPQTRATRLHCSQSRNNAGGSVCVCARTHTHTHAHLSWPTHIDSMPRKRASRRRHTSCSAHWSPVPQGRRERACAPPQTPRPTAAARSESAPLARRADTSRVQERRHTDTRRHLLIAAICVLVGGGRPSSLARNTPFPCSTQPQHALRPVQRQGHVNGPTSAARDIADCPDCPRFRPAGRPMQDTSPPPSSRASLRRPACCLLRRADGP